MRFAHPHPATAPPRPSRQAASKAPGHGYYSLKAEETLNKAVARLSEGAGLQRSASAPPATPPPAAALAPPPRLGAPAASAVRTLDGW